jgi:hypothetical protein
MAISICPAKNYQLIEEESTGGMIFRQGLQAHGRGIRWGHGPGIISSWMLIQTGKIRPEEKIKMCEKGSER